MPKVELSVVWCLAVSLTLGLVIAEDILESKVFDGLIGWKAVVNSSLFADSAVA
jgi:hypothetical protein